MKILLPTVEGLMAGISRRLVLAERSDRLPGRPIDLQPGPSGLKYRRVTPDCKTWYVSTASCRPILNNSLRDAQPVKASRYRCTPADTVIKQLNNTEDKRLFIHPPHVVWPQEACFGVVRPSVRPFVHPETLLRR